ncbi:uncharacterized protein LOC124691591 isoform X2 [Lolium rigidum]|uniref:uncharacterized protein LOC124691591 isoform X2 n=1 Tax=Lolium rigidum TaxID=89674 RepID=UPI001F5E2634|nr:uncharacterized protein LOC124691591 isoform X2 [Lolium rigidum]XP_047080839.1 uncharacterized protein LOC124691591 isoform X2 [Lolium rigidum]
MAGATADEREILVDLAVRQSPPLLHRPQEMASLPIPQELLPDIFLRLPDPADLARASAACVSFRRHITDRSFLRQYRKLHAPPLLGFVEIKGEFHRASPPYPSASAASAVALAADFSFSFLPAPACQWFILDIRDSRVLLYRTCLPGTAFLLKEMLVCDPLHRQYLRLPPIPDELSTSVEKWHTFLVHQSDLEAAEETAFRVIWMACLGDKLAAFVFSSTTGQWQAGPSHSGWIESSGALSRSQYANGCFYWVTDCREKLLVLDTRRMEFSTIDAPPETKLDDVNVAIVEAGEGRLGMFVLPCGSDLSYIIRRNNVGSSGQWQLEKTISLGYDTYWYCFVGSMRGHLFLEHMGDFFLLDVKTFKLETVSASDHTFLWPRAYSNFPPSLLSSPTVASGWQRTHIVC